MDDYRYLKGLRDAGILMHEEIFFTYKELGSLEFLIGTDRLGYIFSRERFQELVKLWTNFYESATDEWIEDRNKWKHIRHPAKIRNPGQDRNRQAGYIYVLEGGGYYKIGKTINVDARIAQISPKLPFEVKLLHVIATNDYTWAEELLHQKYDQCRVNGEWFMLDSLDIPWVLAIKRMDH